MAEISENISAGWLHHDPQSCWESASDFTENPALRFVFEDGHVWRFSVSNTCSLMLRLEWKLRGKKSIFSSKLCCLFKFFLHSPSTAIQDTP